MNSFCDTVCVIVILLRRREAGEKEEMKARGVRWEGGKRKRGLFSLPIIHCVLNISFYYCCYFSLNTQWEPLRRREVLEDFLT